MSGGTFHPEWLEATLSSPGELQARVAAIRSASTDSIAPRSIIPLLDLTTLSAEDTVRSVQTLCGQALRPVAHNPSVRVAAVCVAPRFVPTAVEALARDDMPVAAGIIGRPGETGPLERRLALVREAVAAGAREVDVVISTDLALSGSWVALFDEVCALREQAYDRVLKTILGTGMLQQRETFQASMVCMMAGADFIKTSTGMDTVNATLPAGITMAGAIRLFHRNAGRVVGLKPAGGIRTASEAAAWLTLVEQDLGNTWMTPTHFRIGASGLLANLVKAEQPS